jgi:hypothetical protein
MNVETIPIVTTVSMPSLKRMECRGFRRCRRWYPDSLGAMVSLVSHGERDQTRGGIAGIGDFDIAINATKTTTEGLRTAG